MRATIVSIGDDQYPNARAIVSIENTNGAESAPLDAAAFSITVDGAPVPVTAAQLASSEDAPLDLLFTIDTSGSMEGAPLASAKTAAKALIAELGAQDRIAVLHFGDAVTLAQDFTTDRALTNAAIDALVAQGNTALYQATAAAAVAIANSSASRRVVVLLSDGADFGGRSIATRDEAIAAAASAGVPFFTIAQGTDLDRPYLQQLAEVTRGRALEAPRPEDLNALYVSIGRLLKSQYVVTFDASTASADGSNVEITVKSGELSAVASSRFAPSGGFLPTIALEGVTAGETIDAPREITVTVSSGTPRIRWYVDDVNVFEGTAPPYVFTFNPAAFAEGEHTVRAAAGEGAAAVESRIAFRSVPPPAASGGLPIVPIAAVTGVVVLGVAGFVVMRSRAPKREAPIPAEQRTTSWAAQVAQRRAAAEGPAEPREIEMKPEDIGKALGLLISRGGSDLGSEYKVGGKPVSVGAGAACGVRIRDLELASEEARIWVRGEHLMLHMFTRLTSVESGGAGGGWQILEPGDTFQIGQHTFEFRLLPAEQPAVAADSDHADAALEALGEADGGATPNILRDAEQGQRHQQPSPQPQRFSDLMPRG